MEKYNLVLVDMQNDFCNSDGSLYVNGAEYLVSRIINFINTHKDEIDKVIFTLDWHPSNHESFKDNGGIWPSHCVNYSTGAAIPDCLIEVCYKNDIPVKFFRKGWKEDEYGAFADIKTTNQYMPELKEKWNSWVLRAANPCRENAITVYSTNFVVGGLCGDYCVMETIKNLRKCDDFKVKAATDLIMSIDGGKKFDEYIKETNLEIL